MNRLLKIVALAALPVALGAAAPTGSVLTKVDATLGKAYNGYHRANGPAVSDWNQPVFSAETTRLIRAWKKHNREELTGLSDYGWFCECQDWDAKAFGWKRLAAKQIAPGKAEVKVRVTVGWSTSSTQRLILVPEGGRWLIDDLFSDSAPRGIKAGLHQELLEKPGT